jgi:hypothetical protein
MTFCQVYDARCAQSSFAYRHLDMQGEMVEITDQGANEHINALSKKCRGKDHEPSRPEVRGSVSSRQSLQKIHKHSLKKTNLPAPC